MTLRWDISELFKWIIWLALGFASVGQAAELEFLPCNPVSEVVDDYFSSDAKVLPSLKFCAEWNPEFGANGHHCCGKIAYSRRGHRVGKGCSAGRSRGGGYCGEVTPEQQAYTDGVLSGTIPDVLATISEDLARGGAQSYCTVNNGFLVSGRRLVPTATNRIVLRSPQRCTEFGTDGMIGLLEWTGREVAKQYPAPEYSQAHLVVGDVSAPRGGCLLGPSGRKGHASHTNGHDADISFLVAKPGKESPVNFHRDFDPKTHWWLFKQIFKNPFACIKVIFLDAGHIRRLRSVAGKDPDWSSLHRFIRHMPGHKNHFHVRIGEGPGPAGCVADAKPELEMEDDNPEFDLMPSLPARQGSDI